MMSGPEESKDSKGRKPALIYAAPLVAKSEAATAVNHLLAQMHSDHSAISSIKKRNYSTVKTV